LMRDNCADPTNHLLLSQKPNRTDINWSKRDERYHPFSLQNPSQDMQQNRGLSFSGVAFHCSPIVMRSCDARELWALPMKCDEFPRSHGISEWNSDGVGWTFRLVIFCQ
jgi:hypothetical protein